MNWNFVMILFTFYGILVLVNIPAPFLGLRFESAATPKLWYAPPGFVIPVVWFILFTLLAIARYQLVPSGGSTHWWLYALALLCATYAYYTLGLSRITGISALWFGLFGNILVIVFASLVVFKLFSINRTAAILTIPLIVWTAYASLIVVGEMRQQKLI